MTKDNPHTPTPLIYSAISKVMKDVGAIGKNNSANGSGFGYKFRGIDDIYNALNPLLASNGLFLTSQIVSHSIDERENGKGGVVSKITIRMKWTIHAQDGSSVTTETLGEANDFSDKASNKAMSSAYKYALMQLFCIPTEEPKDSEYDDIQTPQKKKNTYLEEYILGDCQDENLRAIFKAGYAIMPEDKKKLLGERDPENFPYIPANS